MQRQAEDMGDRLRGLLRALQVARIDRIEPGALLGFVCETACKTLSLLETARRQWNIDVPLDALDAVPFGLAVPDEKNLRGHEMGVGVGSRLCRAAIVAKAAQGRAIG